MNIQYCIYRGRSNYLHLASLSINWGSTNWLDQSQLIGLAPSQLWVCQVNKNGWDSLGTGDNGLANGLVSLKIGRDPPSPHSRIGLILPPPPSNKLIKQMDRSLGQSARSMVVWSMPKNIYYNIGYNIMNIYYYFQYKLTFYSIQ